MKSITSTHFTSVSEKQLRVRGNFPKLNVLWFKYIFCFSCLVCQFCQNIIVHICVSLPHSFSLSFGSLFIHIYYHSLPFDSKCLRLQSLPILGCPIPMPSLSSSPQPAILHFRHPRYTRFYQAARHVSWPR